MDNYYTPLLKTQFSEALSTASNAHTPTSAQRPPIKNTLGQSENNNDNTNNNNGDLDSES